MKIIRMIVWCLMALFAVNTVAQDMAPLPLDPAVRYGKLDNGLTYYIRHNEEPKGLAHFYIAQKVGSVQEEEDQRGLAHFLEHMAFNGSKTFPADGQLIKTCENMGVKFGYNLNAYTSTDETVYNIDDVPVNNEANIDTCLWILHDWADGLLLTEEEINKERGVIHEEWRMRSSAGQRILNRRLEELYPGSRYGKRMPIGLMSVVDNFAPDFLRSYYKKWYRPDLQGIVIVGDIDVDQIENKVKAIFGPIQMPANAAKYETYPVPDNDEAIIVVDSDKEQQYGVMMFMYKTEPMPAEMRASALGLVQNYMTTIICSVLNERLSDLSKKEGCPFLQASVGYGTYLLSKTADCVEVDVVPQPGRETEALQAVMTELERARQFGITNSEINRAREEFLSQVEKVYDNRDKQKNNYYTQQYIRHFLSGDAIPDIATEFQLYQTIAPQLPAEVLNQTIQEMLASVEKNFVLLGMFPEKEGSTLPTPEQLKQAIAAARTAQLEAFIDNVSNEPLVAQKPQPGKIIKEEKADFGYTKWTLANGANVFFKPTDFNNSEVIMSASSKGGLSLVAQEDLLNGIVMTDIMNSCGWGNFDSSELEKALAGKQVSLGISMGQVEEGMSGKSTPKDLRTLFELIYLHYQEVKDDPDAFRTVMDATRVQLENAEKLPMKSFQDSINVALYQHHPRRMDLTLDNLSQINYDTVKRIYKDRFQSIGDFNFYFTGAINVDSLRTFTEQYLAPLPGIKGERESYKNWDLKIASGERNLRYNREMETPQAYTIQVWSGDTPYDMEKGITLSALGAALDQMLMKSIREDAGLSYSVSAQAQADFRIREDYLLQIITPFTPAKVDSVHLLIKEGIEEVAMKGISQRYLDDFKKFELKQLEDNQRQNSYWQSLIALKEGWGRDEATGMKEAIENMTSEKVQQFVKDVMLKQNNKVTVTMLPADLTE